MAGYTRQDTTGQLANGNPIDADLFNDEYDAIESAFNASTGHTHDGTAGGGAPIESIGPSQELEVESSAVFPRITTLLTTVKQHYAGKMVIMVVLSMLKMQLLMMMFLLVVTLL